MIRLDPEVLDRARYVLGLSSDYELAEYIGRTPACVSNWRRGRNAPGLQDLVTLQKITGCPYGEMLLIPESV